MTNLDAIIHFGAIECATDVMGLHRLRADVIRCCLALLKSVCRTDQARHVLVAINFVSRLTVSIEIHFDNRAVTAEAVDLLWRMFVPTDDAISLLLHAPTYGLRQPPPPPSHKRDENISRLRKQTLDCGGTTQILRLVKIYRDEADKVNKLLMALLAVISATDSEMATKLALTMTANGCQDVMSLLLAKQRDAGVVEKAMRVQQRVRQLTDSNL